jgi:hypothetical protein
VSSPDVLAFVFSAVLPEQGDLFNDRRHHGPLSLLVPGFTGHISFRCTVQVGSTVCQDIGLIISSEVFPVTLGSCFFFTAVCLSFAGLHFQAFGFDTLPESPPQASTFSPSPKNLHPRDYALLYCHTVRHNRKVGLGRRHSNGV